MKTEQLCRAWSLTGQPECVSYPVCHCCIPETKHQTPCKPCTKQDVHETKCDTIYTSGSLCSTIIYHRTARGMSSLKTSSFLGISFALLWHSSNECHQIGYLENFVGLLASVSYFWRLIGYIPDMFTITHVTMPIVQVRCTTTKPHISARNAELLV